MTGLLIDVLPWSLSGDARDQRLYVVTLAFLCLGTLLCVVALRVVVVDVPAVAVASAAAAAWLLSNEPRQGRTLLELLPGNGVTTADLAVLPAAALVVALVRRRVRDR